MLALFQLLSAQRCGCRLHKALGAYYHFGLPIPLIINSLFLFIPWPASLGSFSLALRDALFRHGRPGLGLDQHSGLWTFAQRQRSAACMPVVASVSSETAHGHLFQLPSLAPSPNPSTLATSFPCCLPTLLLLPLNLKSLNLNPIAHFRRYLVQILRHPS